jgi:hypothetical protein
MDSPDKFLNFSATAWTAIGSIVGAASVVVLSVFNGLFLKAAVKSANASSKQAESANDQTKAATAAIRLTSESNQIERESLQQQQRPWVGLDENYAPNAPFVISFTHSPVDVGPLSIDKDGTASANYTIRVKNFGEGPAQCVLVKASLMVTEDLKDIEAEQQSLTRPNEDRSIGTLLFPGTVASIGSASVFPSARMKSATFDHLFEVWFVGVIHYWDRFGNHYYTGFRYWMVDPQQARPFRFSASPDSSVTHPFWPHGTGGFVK